MEGVFEMNRTQFILLNVIAAGLIVLILVSLLLARENQRINGQVAQYQAVVNDARQAEIILRQMTVRIARGSDQDPELRKLLQRHELKAVLMVDGKKKEYP